MRCEDCLMIADCDQCSGCEHTDTSSKEPCKTCLSDDPEAVCHYQPLDPTVTPSTD